MTVVHITVTILASTICLRILLIILMMPPHVSRLRTLTHAPVVVNPEGRSADSLARCCSPVQCCLVHCSPLHCSIKQLLKHRKNTVQQWCSAIHYTESKNMLYWIQQYTIKGDSFQNWLPCLRQHCKSKYARPRRWYIFWNDGMSMVFHMSTIGINGFSNGFFH